MSRILVTGAGDFGTDQAVLRAQAERSSPRTSPSSISPIRRHARSCGSAPTVIINRAAYTAVDRPRQMRDSVP
jgi:dTDP-4-dehydrorhamnose reductase